KTLATAIVMITRIKNTIQSPSNDKSSMNFLYASGLAAVSENKCVFFISSNLPILSLEEHCDCVFLIDEDKKDVITFDKSVSKYIKLELINIITINQLHADKKVV
ncbi:10999_t:CDS:2, partial [Dentiscutata heterogama]